MGIWWEYICFKFPGLPFKYNENRSAGVCAWEGMERKTVAEIDGQLEREWTIEQRLGCLEVSDQQHRPHIKVGKDANKNKDSSEICGKISLKLIIIQ